MRVGRYLANDVIGHTGAVTLVLLAIFITGRFVKYLAQAATGELAADILLPIMFYRLPGFLELLLPLGLFIGILMAYGRLYVESEMVILSACGLGPLRLAALTLLPAFLVTAIVATLALYLTPIGAQRAEQLLRAPSAMQGLQLVGEGRFQAWGGGDGISYAKRIDEENGLLERVFLYEEQTENDGEGGGVSLTVAQRGEVVRRSDLGARYLELQEGVRYTGVIGRADFSVVEFERFGQRLPDLQVNKRRDEVDGKPTLDLLDSSSSEERAALHWRLSLAVMVPIVALLALSLSKTNHRRGRYLQLAPALLVHLCYLLLLASARTRAAEGEGDVEQLWLIHGGFALLAALLLFWPSLRQVSKH
ncbi:MAG: LPS export ABC transporter permease LptF [Pseudomonadota bacterium]